MEARGFFSLRRPEPPKPIPPGQYLEKGLSAGPTLRTPLADWTFGIEYEGSVLAPEQGDLS